MEAQTPPVQVYHEALPQRKAGINGLAIASFVCSLCWGYGLLSIVSIVFALVARSQIRKNAEITTDVMRIDDALASGALAFFGDRYPEQNVRVVTIPDASDPRG